MHKRIVIIILIAIAATAVCWYYCIFTPYNYFTAKQHIKNGKINFISFGRLAPENNWPKVDSLRKKYGFKTLNIGCVVTNDEIRGISFYNKVVENYLNKRNGENWNVMYLQELADLRNE